MADKVEAFQRERDRRSARFRFLFVLFLSAIGILALAVTSLGQTGSTVPPMRLELFSLRELYPEALKRARVWKHDAIMTMASFDAWFPEDSIGRYASFGFRSPSSPSEYLILSVKERSGIPDFSVTPGEFTSLEPPLPDPITPNSLAIDSPEALDISLANGGSDFLRDREGGPLWPTTIYLHYEDDVDKTGPIVWRVEYFVPPLGPALRVVISAETGELLESNYREARSPPQ